MTFFKRLTVFLVAAMMSVCMLAGCSGSEGDTQQPAGNETSAAALSIEEIYTRISELGVLPEMLMLDDAYISGYYGIDESAVLDKVLAVAEDSLKGDTVIIMKAVDGAAAEEMAACFNRVNNQRLAELESYNPEQYARVENAVIKCSGSYVYYLVTDDNAAAAQIIESNIG